MDDRTERMQKRFEIPVMVAALLVVPSMLLIAQAATRRWW